MLQTWLVQCGDWMTEDNCRAFGEGQVSHIYGSAWVCEAGYPLTVELMFRRGPWNVTVSQSTSCPPLVDIYISCELMSPLTLF